MSGNDKSKRATGENSSMEVVWMLRDARGIDFGQLAFLTVVASRGVMTAKWQTASVDMGMSKATYYRYRDSLIEKNLIEVGRRYDATTVYRVNLDELKKLVPEVNQSQSETDWSHSETEETQSETDWTESETDQSQSAETKVTKKVNTKETSKETKKRTPGRFAPEDSDSPTKVDAESPLPRRDCGPVDASLPVRDGSVPVATATTSREPPAVAPVEVEDLPPSFEADMHEHRVKWAPAKRRGMTSEEEQAEADEVEVIRSRHGRTLTNAYGW